MATITLKNVSAELHARLVQRARAHKRSLNQEAIRCLERELMPEPVDSQELLERIRASRRRLRQAGVQDLDEAFLQRAKAEGRE